jgi:uncharacterized protein YjbI with pentapeptide repeats
MDTNLNIPVDDMIELVDILDLKTPGFGPKGFLTRGEWREECLRNLHLGANSFKKWQEKCLADADPVLLPENIECKLIYVGDHKDTDVSSFSPVHPGKYLDFMGVVFKEDMNLYEYEFIMAASFIGARFFKRAIFFKTVFNESVDFSNVEFFQTTYFSKVHFKKESDFKYSKFLRYADFQNSIFNNDADFHFTYFDSMSFKNAKFLDNSNFYNIVVGGFSVFESATFKSVVHFERARFIAETPAFRGCSLDATSVEFEGAELPLNEIAEKAISNISFLKRLSDEHGQTDQALRFNAIELRLKRLSSNSDIGYKTVTWLYEKLSNYGRSFMRPILSYITLLVVSAIIAMTYSTYSKSPVEESQVLCKQTKDQPQLKLSYERAVFEYAMFRAGGLMDFTDTGKQNNAVNCRLFEEPIEPPLMRAWGIFKGIASIALLFLAALGLRNKYRIK